MQKVLKGVVQLCSGLRFRLLLLVLLVCAPLVLLTLRTASEDRRRALANWPQRAQRIAQFASREEALLTLQTRQLLLAMTESAAARSLDGNGCKGLLERLLAASPRYENVGILGTNRQLIASSRPMPGFVRVENSLPPSPRPSPIGWERGNRPQSSRFAFLSRFASLFRAGNKNLDSKSSTQKRAGKTPIQVPDPNLDWNDLPVGRLYQQVMDTRTFSIGEFSSETHGDTIALGSPILDCFGEPQGVAFATLNYADTFGSQIHHQLPRGAEWSEAAPGGKILIDHARFSAASRAPLMSMEQATVVPGADTTKPIELVDDRGVPMVYAFARRQSQFAPEPLLAVISIPKPVLFAEADRVLFRNLSWLGMAAVLAVALGWFGSNFVIVRPLRALVNCTSRVAAGDFTVRTGLVRSRDELGRLTATFDQMAEALEQRELERKGNSYKLQALSQRLVEIQESERRHIARELHDEIGQSLTLAEMNLQAAIRTAGKGALLRRLQASVQAVERVLEQVQDLSLNLRPSLLDDLGLGPTLQWYISRHAGLTGLHTHLRVEPLESRLETVIETECFRITQEALTNIVRHANARTVTIELTQENDYLHLSVRDDGIGFHVSQVREAAQRGASLGLLSMEERAALAGGRLELESAPGEGTRVDAWFPLKWRFQALSE